MYVVPRALEPQAALVRGLLVLFYDGPALALEPLERAGHVRRGRQRAGERDRVLHRELRARPDGEVRRVQRVAQAHDVRATPAPVPHEQEIYPARVVRQK